MDKSKTLAIFASDKGPGDAERSSILSQAGTFLAKQKVQLVCPVHAGDLCVPLIKSAQAAGGDVLVIADDAFELPSALDGIPVERVDEKTARQHRLAEICGAFVGLPGSLASVTSLYETWVATEGVVPVALLNRNRAFEVLRGFAADVVSASVKDVERQFQFADSIEDLWNKLSRTLAAT